MMNSNTSSFLFSSSHMTKLQREKYLQKVAKLSLQEAKVPSFSKAHTSGSNEIVNPTKILNICRRQFNVENCAISTDILQNIFSKAEKLVLGTNSICPSPGSVNAKLVESKSGSRLHFVTVKAKHKYSCDSDCAMFKCAKICSHTIACAYLDDQLRLFLNQVPNLYEFAKSDTKQKAGKKPSKQKNSSKSTIKAITEQKLNSPSFIVSTPPVIPTSIESVLSMNSSNSTNA